MPFLVIYIIYLKSYLSFNLRYIFKFFSSVPFASLLSLNSSVMLVYIFYVRFLSLYRPVNYIVNSLLVLSNYQRVIIEKCYLLVNLPY